MGVLTSACSASKRACFSAICASSSARWRFWRSALASISWLVSKWLSLRNRNNGCCVCAPMLGLLPTAPCGGLDAVDLFSVVQRGVVDAPCMLGRSGLGEPVMLGLGGLLANTCKHIHAAINSAVTPLVPVPPSERTQLAAVAHSRSGKRGRTSTAECTEDLRGAGSGDWGSKAKGGVLERRSRARNDCFHASVMPLCDCEGSLVSLKNDEFPSCSSHAACTFAHSDERRGEMRATRFSDVCLAARAHVTCRCRNSAQR